jgi:hypothetical protein
VAWCSKVLTGSQTLSTPFVILEANGNFEFKLDLSTDGAVANKEILVQRHLSTNTSIKCLNFKLPLAQKNCIKNSWHDRDQLPNWTLQAVSCLNLGFSFSFVSLLNIDQ